MKKKRQILLCMFMLMLFLVGCGSSGFAKKENNYDKAMISYGNGNIKTVEIQSWDFVKENYLQIVADDGAVYLVDSTNCILVKESKLQK